MQLKPKIDSELIDSFKRNLASTTNAQSAAWCVIEEIFAKTNRYIDAVVYLADEDGTYLKQVAAFGDKITIGQTIKDPIIIETGEGIVGSVFVTKRSRILYDTTKDSNYIIDDRFRFSELAVPIMFEDRIYGVLDSEHSQEAYFNKEDQHNFEEVARLLGAHLTHLC
jgi:putative methionine-R-sulfoxide reductase with GAF domain